MAIDLEVEGIATYTRGLRDGGCTQAASKSYRPEDVVTISIAQNDGGATAFEYVVPEDAGFGGRSGQWAQVTYEVDFASSGTPPSTFWVQDDAGTVIARFVGRDSSTVKLSAQMTLTFSPVHGAACTSCESCGWYDYDLHVAIDGGGAMRIPYRSAARIGEWVLLHNGSPTKTAAIDSCANYKPPLQAIVFNRAAPP